MLDLEEWPFLSHMRPQNHECTITHGPKPFHMSKSPPNYQTARKISIESQLHPRLQAPEQRKRQRALDDIEGDNTLYLQRKKRKLRHSLSTSRLSKPYAVPPTYIPSRKSLREGIWARQRVAGRNLLRKAAALNSYSKKRREHQLALGRQRPLSSGGAISPRLKPSRSKSPSGQRTPSPSRQRTPSPSRQRTPSPSRQRTPSPSSHKTRSPLSSTSSTFSDFHIFDFEDDTSQEDDSEWMEASVINSDFGKLQEVEWDIVEDYGFDGSSTLELDIYSFDPGGKGKAMGMILENEQQNEVSLAPRVI